MPTVLRLHSYSGFLCSEIREYLSALELAYTLIGTFETLEQRDFERMLERALLSGRAESLEIPEDLSMLMDPSDRLTVSSVRLESPGFWDFIGKLNPLEVIRQYLNDRHERLKDREYRNELESRKLYLENLKIENHVVRERIEIAKSAGISPAQLKMLLNTWLHRPLEGLDVAQDKGLIKGAELVEVDSPGAG